MRPMKKSLIAVVVLALVAAGYVIWVRPHQENATPTPSESAAPESVTYTSDALGITFQYVPNPDVSPISVLEEGDKVIVYPSGTDPERGQYVQVFEKDASETFEAAIRRQILAEYPSKECTVEITASDTYSGAKVAEIGYPAPSSTDEVFWANASLCNTAYDRTNGLRYFLYDETHPDRFIFLDVGQYAIPGVGLTPWHETLRIIDR